METADKKFSGMEEIFFKTSEKLIWLAASAPAASAKLKVTNIDFLPANENLFLKNFSPGPVLRLDEFGEAGAISDINV